MTVWVLAATGHRLHIMGVYDSYEAAVDSLRDPWDDEDEDDEDSLLEGYELESFLVES